MNIMEIIEKAQADVDRLKRPSVREFRNFIDPISNVSGQGGTGEDDIVSIDIRNHSNFPAPVEKYLVISMTYEVRCCHKSREIKIPMRIVLADDPIKAANIWKAEHDAAIALRKMQVALRDSHTYSNQYNDAKAKLELLLV